MKLRDSASQNIDADAAASDTGDASAAEASTLRVQFLWRDEGNPFRSVVGRPSQHAGETIWENHSWMCFQWRRGTQKE